MTGGADGTVRDPSDILSPEAVARRARIVRRASRATLRRRRLIGNTTRIVCYLALVIALIPLVALVSYTIERGVSGLSVDFFSQLPVPQGVPGIFCRQRWFARYARSECRWCFSS